MKDQTKVFHSFENAGRERIHTVLVRPEISQNVGSVARALANMGIRGSLSIVGSPGIIDGACRKLAKHAAGRLERAIFCETLPEVLEKLHRNPRSLVLAATARSGSPHRPHPSNVREAVKQAVDQLLSGSLDNLVVVFGPESDGLCNEEVQLCDWVVSIPSSSEYRSLNLAQAVLIFAYEMNVALLESSAGCGVEVFADRKSLVAHGVRMAEVVGFVLPGDPFKMKPRLREIFSRGPSSELEARTLHGLLDQVIRTVQKGRVDYKGKFRNALAKTRKIEPSGGSCNDRFQG